MSRIEYVLPGTSVIEATEEIAVELSEYRRAIREHLYGRAFACLHQAHKLMETALDTPEWKSYMETAKGHNLPI